RKGIAFAEALAEAQTLGYAEADPTFDVEGVDAAHKLSLMAAIVFGVLPAFNVISAEGLSAIRASDVQFARELGYRIKPLAIGKRRGEELELRVHPTLIPADHLLASVDGALNAISVHGDAVGQTVYIGPGAGAEPTASAVIADLVDIARDSAPVASLGQPVDHLGRCAVLAPGAVETACYLRLRVDDAPGVLRSVTSILADLDISIEAILQKEPRDQPHATLAIITSRARIERHDAALQKLLALPFVQPGYTRLRVEYFND
ncbi:MAG: homoserine dehydrogenase, partial [Sinobacteraceae bacterium]|nr:homoserine dehydrogenase [Nevskiaceae bacterium]